MTDYTTVDVVPAGDVAEALTLLSTDKILVSAGGVTRRASPDALLALLGGTLDGITTPTDYGHVSEAVTATLDYGSVS